MVNMELKYVYKLFIHHYKEFNIGVAPIIVYGM